MKINKVADEMVAPAWAFGSKSLDDYEKNNALLKNEVERLNVTPKAKVSEETLAKECSEIEKAASSGKAYHYNSTWSNESVSHLKEYALACGLDKAKVKGVDPTSILRDMDEIDRKAKASYMTKTASVATTENKFAKLVLADPFHLDEKAEVSVRKEEWEKIDRQTNLKDAPSMTSGVRPLRGGEDYFENSESRLAKNQNSITNPKAIETLAEDTTLDTGERLKMEQLAKLQAKKDNKKEWEQSIVKSMEKNDIVPKGAVFQTESLNPQSGLNKPSSQMGVYSKVDKNDIPEKTAGEKVKESRKEWNDSIKKPVVAKDEFRAEKAQTRGVSDIFAEELKKSLKKG